MANEVKSIRIEDGLARQLGKDVNFSNVANQAIKEYLNKSVWVPNFQIEQYAKISANQLLKRIKKVEYLRYSDSALKFTFYPVSQDELQWNKNIHAYANGNYNLVHDSFVYFNLRFPLDFFLFLRGRTLEQVQACIHGFLAFLYWIDRDKRTIMEEQLEKKTLRNVIKIVKTESFSDLERLSEKMHKDPKARAEYCQSYLQLMFHLGIDPVIFPYVKVIVDHLHHPIHFSDALRAKSYLKINIPAGYMRNIYDDTDDWQSICVRGVDKNDNLLRAESNAEPWKSWLAEYSFYHYREINGPPKRGKKNNG